MISQVFFKDERRSCKAAVGRIASLWSTLGKIICSTNTGAYCRARAKISWEAFGNICCQIAQRHNGLFRRMCQCPKCGPLFVEDSEYRVLEFLPANTDNPNHVFERG